MHLSTIVLVFCVHAGSAQYSSDFMSRLENGDGRALFDQEITQIPDDILICYTDRTLWRRLTRLPHSIDSLVELIRKIELHPDVTNWTPGRLAATVIHRFRFDGIKFDPCVDTSSGALPFRLDMRGEFAKMVLIWQLISGDRLHFPEDSLSQEEKCSMHWMLSYSVNDTFREEELFWQSDYENSGSGSHNREWNQRFNHDYDDQRRSQHEWGNHEDWRPPSYPIDCADRVSKSRAPWEMGVVWSPTGPVAAGTMLAGLAAGLQPETITWTSGQVDNGWAASLAGDLAQTAIMKLKEEPYIGPDGYFNSTICPMEFYLRLVPEDNFVYSHLTVSEINGGLDGILLSDNAYSWERHSEFTLSQIIEMYYSNQGIEVQGSSPILSSCDRYANYYKMIPANKLTDQAFAFGSQLKKLLVIPIGDNALTSSISSAKVKLDEKINVLDQSLNDYGPCWEQRERDGFPVKRLKGYEPSPIDEEYISAGIADVEVILDTSIYDYFDVLYQKQVVAAITNELDIWTSGAKLDGRRVMIPGGSLVEVLDGRFGNVIVTSDTMGSINKAHLACNITRSDVPMTGDLDPANAIEAAVARISERESTRQEQELTAGRSLVILLIMFSRVASSDQRKFENEINRIRRHFPSIHFIVATRWAPVQEFQRYVKYPEFDVFILDQYDEEIRAERDGRRIAKRIMQTRGQIFYNDCRDPKKPHIGEAMSEQIIYAVPGYQRFLEVNPRYFQGSKELTITFESKYNSIDVCWSRASPEEQALKREVDRRSKKKTQLLNDFKEECKSIKTGSSLDVEFRKPCPGLSVLECPSIFFRIIGIDSGGSRCQTQDRFPCRTANSALVTISHEGMRCSATNINQSHLAMILIISHFCLKNIV